MVIERKKASTPKYVVAAVITAIIFLLGLFVGLTIEGQRVNIIQDAYLGQRIDFASSQLQYDFISTLDSQENCPGVFSIFYNNLKSLDTTRSRIDVYARDSKLSDASFATLKREYSIQQLQYWLLAKRVQNQCNQNMVRLLYFYNDDTNCPECANQEFVLNYLKSLLGDKLLVFALDGNFPSEPMLNVLKVQYNITRYPTMVVDNQVLQGFHSKDAILDAVCGDFNAPVKECAVRG